MTDTMNEQMRTHLATELPDALRTALLAYKKLMKQQHRDMPDFKKQQEACKAAIVHIECLIKLARTVDETLPPESEEHEDLSAAIQSAMEEVARYKAENE